MKNGLQGGTAQRSAFPIAAPGYPFIFASAFATLVMAILGWSAAALVLLAAFFFTCYFFRDPERAAPPLEGAVICPADGKVVAIDRVGGAFGTDGEMLRVGVFMSVFDVHVNRSPVAGEVRRIVYSTGKFLAANKVDAASVNEQNALRIDSAEGHSVWVVQIAGLIARRIVCFVTEGQRLAGGQRFGLICFGSRVDLYLPPGSDIQVKKGDRVSAGSTIVGFLGQGEIDARHGDVSEKGGTT